MLQYITFYCILFGTNAAGVYILLYYWASVAQSLEQAPFTSEFVGSVVATDSCEKSQSTLCRKSKIFYGSSGFLTQGKLIGWVRINIVKKVISQLS
jgi:hypothetical protein